MNPENSAPDTHYVQPLRQRHDEIVADLAKLDEKRAPLLAEKRRPRRAGASATGAHLGAKRVLKDARFNQP